MESIERFRSSAVPTSYVRPRLAGTVRAALPQAPLDWQGAGAMLDDPLDITRTGDRRVYLSNSGGNRDYVC